MLEDVAAEDGVRSREIVDDDIGDEEPASREPGPRVRDRRRDEVDADVAREVRLPERLGAARVEDRPDPVALEEAREFASERLGRDERRARSGVGLLAVPAVRSVDPLEGDGSRYGSASNARIASGSVVSR